MAALMLAILCSALFSVGYGKMFVPLELGASGFTVTVAVGADSTTIDVVAPVDRWHAVGMSAVHFVRLPRLTPYDTISFWRYEHVNGRQRRGLHWLRHPAGPLSQR